MHHLTSADHRVLPRPTHTLLALGLSAALALSPASLALAAQPSATPDGKSEPPSGQTPPPKPDGENGPGGNGSPGGQPPSMPPSGAPGGAGGPGGPDTMTFDFTGTYVGTVSVDGTEQMESGKAFEATDPDANVALAQNEGSLALENCELTKSGDDSDGDKCNFYGLNSIVTAVGEKTVASLSNCSLSASSVGSNGIFATDNATVTVSDSSISTTADNSRGLDATYGGSIEAKKMSISTQGDHCAAVATDRGGGAISVSDSSFDTAGSGSPLIYSTGDIEVTSTSGTAKGSQIAGMEGLNSVTISKSSLTSTITKATASDPLANGAIIYQSTSGDAEAATGSAASFTATDSTLTSAIKSGSMFYLTNTDAVVALKNTTLAFDSENAALLTVQGNSSNNWGTPGKNGATCGFIAQGETLEGAIDVDSISSANIFLIDGTSWTGTTHLSENDADGAQTTEAPLTLNVASDATWTVTEDCTVSALHAEEGAAIVDTAGKTATIVANGKTIVQGKGDVTVTVQGACDQTLDDLPSVDAEDQADDSATSNEAAGEGFFYRIVKVLLRLIGAK